MTNWLGDWQDFLKRCHKRGLAANLYPKKDGYRIRVFKTNDSFKEYVGKTVKDAILQLIKDWQ